MLEGVKIQALQMTANNSIAATGIQGDLSMRKAGLGRGDNKEKSPIQ